MGHGKHFIYICSNLCFKKWKKQIESKPFRTHAIKLFLTTVTHCARTKTEQIFFIAPAGVVWSETMKCILTAAAL